MANGIERMIADTFMEMAQGLETGSFGKRPKVALTGMGKRTWRRKTLWQRQLKRQKTEFFFPRMILGNGQKYQRQQ